MHNFGHDTTQEPNNASINEKPTISSNLTYKRERSFKSTSMDIRKYKPMNRTTHLETEIVERQQDLLIKEFSKGLDLVWILAGSDSVENSFE